MTATLAIFSKTYSFLKEIKERPEYLEAGTVNISKDK